MQKISHVYVFNTFTWRIFSIGVETFYLNKLEYAVIFDCHNFNLNLF